MSRYSYDLPNHSVRLVDAQPIADIQVHEGAQRALDSGRAKRMSENLVPSALGTVLLSERVDGSLWVVDGQHRLAACRLAGVTHVRAEIHEGLDVAGEATLFMLKNREGVKPNILDECKVGFNAGLPLFVDVHNTLDKFGLKLGPAPSTNIIAAAAGVVRVVNAGGPELLERTLSVIVNAWPNGSKERWDGLLIGAVSSFLEKHGEQVDDEELSKRLGKSKISIPVEIGRRAHAAQVQTGSGNRLSIGRQIVTEIWDANRRTGRLQPKRVED